MQPTRFASLSTIGPFFFGTILGIISWVFFSVLPCFSSTASAGTTSTDVRVTSMATVIADAITRPPVPGDSGNADEDDEEIARVSMALADRIRVSTIARAEIFPYSSSFAHNAILVDWEDDGSGTISQSATSTAHLRSEEIDKDIWTFGWATSSRTHGLVEWKALVDEIGHWRGYYASLGTNDSEDVKKPVAFFRYGPLGVEQTEIDLFPFTGAETHGSFSFTSSSAAFTASTDSGFPGTGVWPLPPVSILFRRVTSFGDFSIVWGFNGVPGENPTKPLRATVVDEGIEAAGGNAPLAMAAAAASSPPVVFDIPVNDDYGKNTHVYLAAANNADFTLFTEQNAFDSFVLPEGFLPPNASMFSILVDGALYSAQAGTAFDFTSIDSDGISRFSVLGLTVNPEIGHELPLGVSFVNSGLTVVQQALPIPEPSSLILAALAGIVFCHRRFGSAHSEH